MCGIAGFAALGPDAVARLSPGAASRRLEAMVASLEHRGPDGSGFEVDDGVALGMCRLAILDPAGGRQPLRNEDDTVRAVFNGEIYNFRQLRRGLEARGHRLRSRSDGEVLVHLWEEQGPECVASLDGMFAFALHDRRRHGLFLARDRLGIKPLYLAQNGHEIAFASELGALLAGDQGAHGIERQIDPVAVAELLSWEYVQAPRTLLRAVRKLAPGTWRWIDLERGTTRDTTYWRPLPPTRGSGDPSAKTRTRKEWVEDVDTALGEAVARQEVSDVPLGCLLSGGVDSSLVAHHLRRARAAGEGMASRDPVLAFSLGFAEPSWDESRHARRVARHLGLEHRLEQLDRLDGPHGLEAQAAGLIDSLLPRLDDPIGDFSIVPTFLVCRLARREVKVVLTGDGGDELFGGYETYRAQLAARLWQRLPRALRHPAEALARRLPPSTAKKGLRNILRRLAEGLAHPAELGHARWRLFAGEALRRELLSPELLDALDTSPEAPLLRLADEVPDRQPVARALHMDRWSYLSDNCLPKVDRMSMACSLEARVPFLDHRLVELALGLPDDLLATWQQSKILLKAIARRHLPATVVDRPKQGFSMPMKHWLRGVLRPLLEELLAPDRLREGGLFALDGVERLRREHLAGRADHAHLLWTLMVIEDWRRRRGARW